MYQPVDDKESPLNKMVRLLLSVNKNARKYIKKKDTSKWSDKGIY